MKLDITHNQEDKIFHTFVDGKECYLRYRHIGPTILEIYETYVPVLERQQGIGTELVQEALRFAQLNNYLVAATCNFTADYLDQHHEYAKMRVEAE